MVGVESRHIHKLLLSTEKELAQVAAVHNPIVKEVHARAAWSTTKILDVLFKQNLFILTLSFMNRGWINILVFSFVANMRIRHHSAWMTGRKPIQEICPDVRIRP